MLIRIAWRNIWRNRTRSLVVIFAIALGLWAGIFASAFVQGMMEGKVNSVIEYEISHFQFHHKQFRDEMLNKHYIDRSSDVEEALSKHPEVLHFSSRLIAMGMTSTANKSGSAKIVGIDTEKEAAVTKLNERLIEGKYFEGVKRNPVLISRRFADKYKIKLRSKLVITLQDKNNEIIAAAFRVVGIYDTGNGIFDELNVFVRQSDLQQLIKTPKQNVHEIAVFIDDYEKSDQLAADFQSKFPDLEVLPWPDLSPGMRFIIEFFDYYLYIIVGIILFALLFSIINTMLMAVLERTKEIGMLMAIGMAKSKVFMMIITETVMISMVGTPLGILFSYISIAYFGKYGIHLSTDVYADMGYSSSIYPYLDYNRYVDVSLMVFIMAVLASVYPALKALRLNPVEAIRKL